jgi:hypothetical protein
MLVVWVGASAPCFETGGNENMLRFRKKKRILRLLKFEPKGDYIYAEVEAKEFDKFADEESALVLVWNGDEYLLMGSPLLPFMIRKVDKAESGKKNGGGKSV